MTEQNIAPAPVGITDLGLKGQPKDRAEGGCQCGGACGKHTNDK